jgi:hypothetical protein
MGCDGPKFVAGDLHLRPPPPGQPTDASGSWHLLGPEQPSPRCARAEVRSTTRRPERLRRTRGRRGRGRVAVARRSPAVGRRDVGSSGRSVDAASTINTSNLSLTYPARSARHRDRGARPTANTRSNPRPTRGGPRASRPWGSKGAAISPPRRPVIHGKFAPLFTNEEPGIARHRPREFGVTRECPGVRTRPRRHASIDSRVIHAD